MPSERDYAACGDALSDSSANHWLEDSDYEALRLSLEIAHAAVEAAVVEARRQGRISHGPDLMLSGFLCTR